MEGSFASGRKALARNGAQRPPGASGKGGVLLALLTHMALWALIFSLPVSGLKAQEMGLSLGTEAPGATLEDLEGNPVQLLDYIGKGKPALVEFWAYWCGQCQRLQPQMNRAQEVYGDRVNVVAVAVAVSQTPAQIRSHLEEHDPGYPFLFDRRGEAVRNYRVPGTAVILIFDAEGKVVYSGAGSGQDLTAALAEILGA